MPFTHLHVHTEFSLLDGASRIKELIETTKALGMDSIAITDHGAMYGVIDFYKEAKKQGVKPIIGCEVYVAPGARQEHREVNGVRYYHLILLAENQTGYRNLVKLVSLANIEGMYYKPRVDKDLLRQYHEGIICLSACIAGEIPRAILQDNMERADALVREYLEIFGRENFFLEIQNHGLPEERKANAGLVELAKKYDVGLVATNDLHYVHREGSEFHDILLCIQMNKTFDDPDRMRFASDDYYLKSPEEMAALFPDLPEAIANTEKIAARCKVDFEFGHLQLPYYPIPAPYADGEAYLRHLCEENLPRAAMSTSPSASCSCRTTRSLRRMPTMKRICATSARRTCLAATGRLRKRCASDLNTSSASSTAWATTATSSLSGISSITRASTASASARAAARPPAASSLTCSASRTSTR